MNALSRIQPFVLPLISAGLLCSAACSKQPSDQPNSSHSSTNRLNEELVRHLATFEAQERLLNETVWAPEILAQQQGQIFESLWDSLNASTHRLTVLAESPVGAVLLGHWLATQSLPHGIQIHTSDATGRLLSEPEWKTWVEQFALDGWELGEIEFRHTRFQCTPDRQPTESTFYFAAQLTHPARDERALIEGDLLVHWSNLDPATQIAPVRQIDASHLVIKSRSGPLHFEAQVLDHLSPPRNSLSIDPLIVYDLDGDGHSEIILAAKNLVYTRQPDSALYRSQPLCQTPATAIHTAVVADFDRDGFPDFLAATLEGLILFPGSGKVSFEQPGRLVLPAPQGWLYPMALTTGDIDNDGDLDLFLGQYRVPYEEGSLPTPYHDANDGHPAYLLLNDGHASFSDATQAANLNAKRGRRTYSASFADFNHDSHLDLVVVSDFAGIDLYRNNGKGQFTDVTDAQLPDPRAFGMSHAIADFNTDGRLDLLMIGMTSPTVDRLQHLDLWHPDVAEDRAMPFRMMYGNRLYLGGTNGGFEQTALGTDVARSGWSWGCAAFDFDNDAFLDLFIANGLESRSSVRDYESEYWLHDRFIGKSQYDPAVYLYFQSKFSRTRGRGESYGGYERNRFYLNQGGLHFQEIGHLLGLALQEDSRHAVADDLDGDGRVDLITTGFETWPDSKQILRVYRNTLEPKQNWIGFRLREEPQRLSPIGATIALHYNGQSAVRHLVTGDSHRSQHGCNVHFGLGAIEQIEKVEVRWPGGQSTVLNEPASGRYHQIQAPSNTR